MGDVYHSTARTVEEARMINAHIQRRRYEFNLRARVDRSAFERRIVLIAREQLGRSLTGNAALSIVRPGKE